MQVETGWRWFAWTATFIASSRSLLLSSGITPNSVWWHVALKTTAQNAWCQQANKGKKFSSCSATKYKQPKLSMHRPPTNTHLSSSPTAFAQSSYPFGLSFPIPTFSFASPPTSSTSYIKGFSRTTLKMAQHACRDGSL